MTSDQRPRSMPPAWREGFTVLEPARLAMNSWQLVRQRRGDGRTVFVLPGFRGSDTSTVPLRSYLRGLNYDARGWGLGTNTGDVGAFVAAMIRHMEPLVDGRRAPLPLIGWSLGGVVAREIARERPDLVEQVITFGSPLHRSTRPPIRVPVTVMYTKSDGVVPWQACIDRVTPDVRHIEVHTTHLGLGLHHRVYVEVARALAARGAAVSRP